MKGKRSFICWLIVLTVIGFFYSPSSAATKKKKPFISQIVIDTSIQRGFLLLNESADMAGVGFGHERSIKAAKKIVRRLKEKARGDPNEKYVLWKVGELEAQIYLEERDLVLQQMRKRQLTINELVDKFNAELGKWRPDFATLYRIHKSMDNVDVRKANEFASSYNQRKRAITREAVYFLEKALVAGDAEKARKELGYCLRNQLYLDISNSKYKRLENRVEGFLHAKEEKPLIETEITAAGRFLVKNDISTARKTLDTAENRLSNIKKHLPEQEAASLGSSLDRSRHRLRAKEDSLVRVNISILRNDGVEAADRYLQKVLRPAGVGRNKAASVDRMIISVREPEESGKNTAIVQLAEDDEESPSVLDDIMSVAKKKAQKKKDSLYALEVSRMWEEPTEQSRSDSIARAARAEKETRERHVRRRVDSLVMEIYTLLEKNNPLAAQKRFEKGKSFFTRHMPPDELAMLGATIRHFVESQSVSAAAERGSAGNRQAAAGRKSRASIRENRDRAQKEILGIYAMLEKNDVDRAYRRFQNNRTPLRKYLAPEAFSMLEMSVKQAYEYNRKK